VRRAGQLVSLVLSRTRKPRAKSFAEEPVQKEVFRWGGKVIQVCGATRRFGLLSLSCRVRLFTY